MTKETGGPAFPHENILSHRGMTLRDYFAAKAMQIILTKNIKYLKDVAETSYAVADEMLEARK